MQKVVIANAVRTALVCGIGVVISVSGCGGGSPIKTRPVVGKVELKDGDIAILTSSSVELKSDADENLRPYGNIDATGKFVLKTLYQGQIVDGAPEGTYKVRIILADQSDEGVPKRKGDPFHKKYLEFATSGLSLTVPSGDYAVTVAKK